MGRRQRARFPVFSWSHCLPNWKPGLIGTLFLHIFIRGGFDFRTDGFTADIIPPKLLANIPAIFDAQRALRFPMRGEMPLREREGKIHGLRQGEALVLDQELRQAEDEGSATFARRRIVRASGLGQGGSAAQAITEIGEEGAKFAVADRIAFRTA